jgi:hypothetical protein
MPSIVKLEGSQDIFKYLEYILKPSDIKTETDGIRSPEKSVGSGDSPLNK